MKHSSYLVKLNECSGCEGRGEKGLVVVPCVSDIKTSAYIAECIHHPVAQCHRGSSSCIPWFPCGCPCRASHRPLESEVVRSTNIVGTHTPTVRVKLNGKTRLVRREFQHRVVSDGQYVVYEVDRI